ncbi:hypothetical protein [Mesorhizobium australicum]|uniref:hypothetical protein n=1 Tax=Mesorhizobium australicum TaxID=536018 RepID=UPI00333AF31F
MDPEAVESGFLDHDDRKAPPGPGLRLPVELDKTRQHASDIAGHHHMLRHFRAGAR